MGLAVAAGIVLLAQLAIDPILQLFHGDAIQSAAERMANGQFEQSGRSFEWKKAWLAFLSAPIFGHGWGSYAWQGFITNVYPTGFRIYENNVLFTHSHNSYLNLLAEMGIIGTLLVLGGLVWSIRGCFQRSNLSAAGVFVLTLMSVSLVHSVVEYPLWYLYPFSLFIGFSPVPNEADLTPNVSSSLKKNMTALAIAVVMACGVGRSIWAYDDFLNYTGPTDVGVVERTNNITGLLRVTQTEPMFRYYAQLKLMDYLDVNDSHFPDWALENARENFRFRPYVNAYKYPLAAYQAGKIDEARDMMFMLYRYYPEKMPAYAVPLINTSHYPQLRDDMIEVCRKYIRDCPY